MGIALGMLLTLGLVASACGGGDDDNPFVPGDQDVSEDLVDEFPDDFPVYPGADIQGSYRGESGGQEGIVAIWSTGDSLEDVSDFYDEELADGPWKSNANGTAGDSAYWNAENEDGSRSAYVTVASQEGDTAITVIVGDNPDSSSGDGDATPDDSGDGDDDPTPDDSDDGGQPAAELPDEVELNDDFPSDSVPLPDNARVTSSTSFSQGGSNTFFVEFYSEDSAEEVQDYFDRELTGNGWTESFTSSSNGELFATYARADDPDGATNNGVVVTIRDSDVAGYVQVSLSVSVVEQ